MVTAEETSWLNKVAIIASGVCVEIAVFFLFIKVDRNLMIFQQCSLSFCI
jgi:hypothetical protein